MSSYKVTLKRTIEQDEVVVVAATSGDQAVMTAMELALDGHASVVQRTSTPWQVSMVQELPDYAARAADTAGSVKRLHDAA